MNHYCKEYQYVQMNQNLAEYHNVEMNH